MKPESTRRSAKKRPARSRGAGAADAHGTTPPGNTQSVRLESEPGSAFQLSDARIEEALAGEGHRDLLEAYFGEELYEEFRTLSRQSRGRRVRGGPRVLILPGIMGSTLGRPGRFFDDCIWVDPVDIARGRLTQLALDTGDATIKAIGVIPLVYLRLKFRLRWAGFDADFHPFDWRKNIEELGAELANRIRSESARHAELYLVAHSMGGLVARAALKKLGRDAGKVSRLIMLGTPNFGSFAPLLALRGAHGMARKLAALDLHNTMEGLVNDVFSTFPGLYQMLPAREKFAAVNLFEPSNWPATGPRINGRILREAAGIHGKLAPGGERMTLVAGINQQTIVSVSSQGGEFLYLESVAGDGTVPLALAQLDGVRTFYAEDEHGSLPSNRNVIRAVIDILRRGTTDLLPTDWSPRRRDTRELREADIVEVPFDGRRGERVSAGEVRHLLDGFASAPQRAEPAARPSSSEAAGATYSDEPVIIGRRRQQRVDIYLAQGDITQVEAEAVVLGLFRGVDPTGPAAAIDRRLGGAITEFTERRMFNGNVGEVNIFPVGRHALAADFVVFAGMGGYDEFDEEVLRLVAEHVARALVYMRVESIATVMMGAGSVTEPREALANLIEGFFNGLRDADASRRVHSITLCEREPARYRQIRSELYQLATSPLFDEVEVTIDEIALPTAAPAPEVRRAPDYRDPVYLFVRRFRDARRPSGATQPGGAIAFQASVLPANGKATVVTDVCDIDVAKLDRHLEGIEGAGFTFAALAKFGTELGELVLPEIVRQALRGVADRHLVIVHDADASRVPWETLCLGGGVFPAYTHGITRKYEAENLSVAKWLEQRRMDDRLNVLLIVNPTGDLAGAKAEGKRVGEIFAEHPSISTDVLLEGQATWTAVRAALRSGKYDVVHYAGHAFFDAQDRANSGILCHGGRTLSGRDLVGLENLPALMFFNACEAGRIRGAGGRKVDSTRDRLDRAAGMAEAFLRGGLANYVGTYWPVGDAAAKAFGATFYGELVKGATVSDALGSARKSVYELKSVDWADYLHYGSWKFTVKAGAGR